MEALRKITVKEILKGKPPRDDDGNIIVQDVCLVYGKARDINVGNTQFGDYNEFVGRFEARQLIGKKLAFQSTRMIVPQPTDDIMCNAFYSAKGQDSTAEVEFAFVIGVEKSERGSEGFRYTCRQIAANKESADPLDAIRALVSEAEPELLALAAPAEDAPASKKSKTKETTDA